MSLSQAGKALSQGQRLIYKARPHSHRASPARRIATTKSQRRLTSLQPLIGLLINLSQDRGHKILNQPEMAEAQAIAAEGHETGVLQTGKLPLQMRRLSKWCLQIRRQDQPLS